MKLVANVKGREYRDRNELCRNCFHVCSSAELLTSHQKVCLENDSKLQITMPTGVKNVKFEIFEARWFSILEVFLDLESLVVPVATVKNNSTFSSTYALEQHFPCSYCMIVVERINTEPLHFEVNTRPECMERFVTKKRETFKTFCIIKRKNFRVFLGHHLQGTRGQNNGFLMLISTMISKKY